MINLTTFFNDWGIVGGNTSATDFYSFWYGMELSGGTIISNITEFMNYHNTTRYEFFNNLQSTYSDVFDEYTFYSNIDDPDIFDFKTFYQHAASYFGGTPVTPTPTPTNTPTPTPTPSPTPAVGDYLLTENGDILNAENGDRIEYNTTPTPTPTPTSTPTPSPSAKAAPTIVFLNRLDSNATNTTYNLSSAIQVNKLGVFAIAVNELRNITSFTINSSPATLGGVVQGSTGGTMAVYYSQINTTGTTTASVTFNSSVSGINFMAYEVSNNSQITHAASGATATTGGVVSINSLLQNDLVLSLTQASFCPTSIDATSQTALTSPSCLLNNSKTRVFGYTMPSSTNFSTTLSTTPANLLNGWVGVVFR